MIYRCSLRNRLSRAALLLVVTVSAAAAQDEQAASNEADNKVRLRQAEDFVGRMEVHLSTGGDVVARVDRPLQFYADSARKSSDGSLWAWGTTGRPLLIMEVFRNANGTRTSAISLASTERVKLKASPSGIWKPEKTQIEQIPLSDAPTPDEREAGRLRQLKEQARRFSGHEFWKPENSRFKLRLLVQPVHRYHDEKTGIIEGAVFVLAHDTNPETLLLLEVVGTSVDKAHWQFSLARLGSAELHVELDGKEI